MSFSGADSVFLCSLASKLAFLSVFCWFVVSLYVYVVGGRGSLVHVFRSFTNHLYPPSPFVPPHRPSYIRNATSHRAHEKVGHAGQIP